MLAGKRGAAFFLPGADDHQDRGDDNDGDACRSGKYDRLDG
jgi:hypothetical protein